ncbi:PREDICTED: glutamyl-tRNA reductase-binding protein, chloroplastic [Nelumbo nucifera]|uniref:Glutamyl-tRNA reductase-binding protein, chloroplastic n=2 Tax=Nelumbo nucifera TaxID=4432 RepID=A0A1U8BL91_NELNU|nr:PREDICTED: glutamyl-tRNA reductase-binding protein, chloroplastic [Nelumbo nucifera]DAD27593.1 TPA_asm: hypothetical protein HUJ06_029061 [Nelumbo nucifera]
MVLHTQTFALNSLPSIFPTSPFCRNISFFSTFSSIEPIRRSTLSLTEKNPFLKSSYQPLKCSLSVVSEPIQKDLQKKPSPAEVTRTIMELTSVGTLSTLTQEGFPLGIGVRFVVDPEGTPILCLNGANRQFSLDRRSSLHVQLEQCRTRSPQCTLQGSLDKPEDRMILKKLQSLWEKRFGEKVDEDLVYMVSVERVLQMEDFMEGGAWVTASEYRNADPDPLRDVAEKIVDEINSEHMDDILRFCNIYVELEFQVKEANMIWVDRLGFDVHLSSAEGETYEVRIPFPREVTDEKGAKSSFNCMSQFAWEVEKNYSAPTFEKVKQLKHISYSGSKMA